jgi:hypothetical protein
VVDQGWQILVDTAEPAKEPGAANADAGTNYNQQGRSLALLCWHHGREG